MPALKPASKHVRLRPHQLAALRGALDHPAELIQGDHPTAKALANRGLARPMGKKLFVITAAGRARARLKADLPDKSQSQIYGKIPGIWEDLP